MAQSHPEKRLKHLLEHKLGLISAFAKADQQPSLRGDESTLLNCPVEVWFLHHASILMEYSGGPHGMLGP